MRDLLFRSGGVLCVGIWTVLALFRGSFWRMRERLGRGLAPAAGRVVAVIPARDERATIGITVRSLPGIRVIVADDESSDGTGEVAAAAGAEVVRVGPRPSGWKGKLWAVSEGVRAAGTGCDYFLLTDADIEYVAPDVLSCLLAKAENEFAGFDLVSAMVLLRCESRAERLLIPAFVFFFFMLYPPGRNSAGAAGGCMLIRREMLERIGGIAAIRGALIDDCALAKAVRLAGGKVWLGVSSGEVVSLRGYGSAAEIRPMIARSAFAQLRHSAWLLVGTIAGLLVTYLLPVLLVLSGDSVAALLGLSAWVMSAVLFTPAVRMYRAPWWTAFCLPGIAVFYLIATVESAVRYWSGNGGEWKGRVQDGR